MALSCTMSSCAPTPAQLPLHTACRRPERPQQLRRAPLSLVLFSTWIAQPSRRSSRSVACAAAQEDILTQFQLSRALEDLTRRADTVLASSGFGSPEFEAEAKRLRDAASQPDLWNDSAKAQEVMLQLRGFEKSEKRAQDFTASAEEVKTALELARDAEEGGDEAEATSLKQEAASALNAWKQELYEAEVEVLMAGKYDSNSCQLNIFAGAGGDESCDWVCMLERMYTSYAEARGWQVKRLDATEGDAIGLKSVDLEVTGDFAFGMLQRESGTHRLVRIWNGKRQTTFAGVEVVPILVDESVSIVDIPDNEMSWSTFRAGGKGGQNVNKVETGVRVTHIPTGIVMKCTEERSQLLNKAKALKKLKAKLLLIQEQQKVQDLKEIKGDVASAQWGAQVRNYVLQPYTLVKDVRSGHERGDAQRVLDGDLGSHIDALLRMQTAAS